MRTTWKPLSNETKPLTFLLALTFLFLFSGSVYGDEPEVKKKYRKNGKLQSETHWKDGEREGLKTFWYKTGKKKYTKHFKDGIENGIRKEWDENGKKTFQGNFVDGNEE